MAYDVKGDLETIEPHQSNGLKAFEYIINHEEEPHRFDLKC